MHLMSERESETMSLRGKRETPETGIRGDADEAQSNNAELS